MGIYKNSTPVTTLGGVSLTFPDINEACLRARLNQFWQCDTGEGKTQLAADAMSYFPHTSMFILARNDMDTRDLFQRINLGKLYQKPSYNLEPIINIETGETEWYYTQFDTEKSLFVPKKLTTEQADRVRRSLENIAGSTEGIKEATSKINTNLIVADELPNCQPAVRAQLFNLFDGCIELGGKLYAIGKGYLVAEHPGGKVELFYDNPDSSLVEKMRQNGIDVRNSNYSVGIATGNIGQEFTESSNELGRALKDRLHVILNLDYFMRNAGDSTEILLANTNPRVSFGADADRSNEIIKSSEQIAKADLGFEKLVMANYLMHGLDYCKAGNIRSKKRLKACGGWPNNIDNHQRGSDESLVLPVSMRAAKSIIRLSSALEQIALEKGADYVSPTDSMLEAYKLVATYSGVLNDAAVREHYGGDKYAAIDAVNLCTRGQFSGHEDDLKAVIEMLGKEEKTQKVVSKFNGRWSFMKDMIDRYLE